MHQLMMMIDDDVWWLKYLVIPSCSVSPQFFITCIACVCVSGAVSASPMEVMTSPAWRCIAARLPPVTCAGMAQKERNNRRRIRLS